MNRKTLLSALLLIFVTFPLTSFAQYPDWNWISTAHSGIFYNRQFEGVSDHTGGFPVVDGGNSSYFITQYQIDSIVEPIIEDTTTTTANGDLSRSSMLSAYPNPSNGTLQIRLNHPIEEGDLIVRDVTGRPSHDFYFQAKEKGCTLQFDDSSTGLRVIEVYKGAQLFIERVMIQ